MRDNIYVFVNPATSQRFCINAEYSGIGYCYPRIFVEYVKDSKVCHCNYDLTMNMKFHQRQSEWDSWFDGTEIYCDFNEYETRFHEIVEVAGGLRLKDGNFSQMILDFVTQCQSQQ